VEITTAKCGMHSGFTTKVNVKFHVGL